MQRTIIIIVIILAREAFKAELATTRAEVKTKIEEHKSLLRERLQEIKDTRKQEAVERIDTQLNTINEKLTTMMASFVDQIERVLDGVESRADKAEANGKDVTEVRAKIAAADSAIADARIAIKAQAGKTYDMNITTEASLRTDVQSTRNQLKNDLEAVRATIKKAHEAVRAAIKSLAQIPGINVIVTASSSASTTQ